MEKLPSELSFVPRLIEVAGPIGATAVLLLVAAYFLFKHKGWIGIGEKNRMVATSRIDKLDAEIRKVGDTVSDIDRRVRHVESDLDTRATKADLQALETTVARIDERQKAMDKNVIATREGVNRIEDFLFTLAGKARP